MKKVIIHSDGGCHGNPDPGGWAAVLEHGQHKKELSGGVPATTNNRMELQAAIEAFGALKEPCEVQVYQSHEQREVPHCVSACAIACSVPTHWLWAEHVQAGARFM